MLSQLKQLWVALNPSEGLISMRVAIWIWVVVFAGVFGASALTAWSRRVVSVPTSSNESSAVVSSLTSSSVVDKTDEPKAVTESDNPLLKQVDLKFSQEMSRASIGEWEAKKAEVEQLLLKLAGDNDRFIEELDRKFEVGYINIELTKRYNELAKRRKALDRNK